MIDLKNEIFLTLINEILIDVSEENLPGFKKIYNNRKKLEKQKMEIDRQLSFPTSFHFMKDEGRSGYSINGIFIKPNDTFIVKDGENGQSFEVKAIKIGTNCENHGAYETLVFLPKVGAMDNPLALFLGNME